MVKILWFIFNFAFEQTYLTILRGKVRFHPVADHMGPEGE